MLLNKFVSTAKNNKLTFLHFYLIQINYDISKKLSKNRSYGK